MWPGDGSLASTGPRALIPHGGSSSLTGPITPLPLCCSSRPSCRGRYCRKGPLTPDARAALVESPAIARAFVRLSLHCRRCLRGCLWGVSEQLFPYCKINGPRGDPSGMGPQSPFSRYFLHERLRQPPLGEVRCGGTRSTRADAAGQTSPECRGDYGDTQRPDNDRE